MGEKKTAGRVLEACAIASRKCEFAYEDVVPPVSAARDESRSRGRRLRSDCVDTRCPRDRRYIKGDTKGGDGDRTIL